MSSRSVEGGVERRDGVRTSARDDARSSAAAPFLGVGGAVLAIGSFLSWASDSASATGSAVNESITGSSFPDGRVVMGIGIAMLVMAVYMGSTRRRGHWYDTDLMGAVLGTVAAVIIVSTWVAYPDSRSADVGLYLSLVGALIGMAGSLAAAARPHRDDDARDAT